MRTTTRPPRLTAAMAVLALLVIAGLTCAARAAHAKTQRTIHDTYDVVWPVAVRYIRVDKGYPIVDKDAETGYVVFTVEDDGKTFRGALELVRGEDSDGRKTVTLTLRIDDRPQYMETGMLTGLLQKLHDEHGEHRDPPGDSGAR